MIFVDETCHYFNIVYKSDSPNIFAVPIIGLTTVSTIDYLLIKTVATPTVGLAPGPTFLSLSLMTGNH